MKLHLGVIDLPYATPTKGYMKHRRHAAHGKGADVTTGDVAKFLEKKYQPIRTFYRIHGDGIADALGKSLEGQVKNLMMGAPPIQGAGPFLGAAGYIEDQFKRVYLSGREDEFVGIPGVPTKAAMNGVNHRLKSGRGKRRPSFIDTGLYQASFKAWVE